MEWSCLGIVDKEFWRDSGCLKGKRGAPKLLGVHPPGVTAIENDHQPRRIQIAENSGKIGGSKRLQTGIGLAHVIGDQVVGDLAGAPILPSVARIVENGGGICAGVGLDFLLQPVQPIQDALACSLFANKNLYILLWIGAAFGVDQHIPQRCDILRNDRQRQGRNGIFH